MWLRTLSALIVAVVTVAGCSRSAPETASAERGPGAETPEAAVSQLVDHLNTPDYLGLGRASLQLGQPGQAALASLVEGATFAEVASALEEGDVGIAANFWAGFAQGAGAFLAESVEIQSGDTIVQDEVEFHLVEVMLSDGEDRFLMTRDADGERIDLFASFGGALADRMVPPVERLLTIDTDDSAVILPELKTIVPSLIVAANQPDISPRAIQDLLRLVELITRIN